MPSQMHQPAGANCPGCGEPVENDDRFCGACGHDLSAVAAPPPGADRPTLAIGVPVEWPRATGTDSRGVPAPVHLPSDLPGTDSAGVQLPVYGATHANTASASGPPRPRHAPGGSGPTPSPASGADDTGGRLPHSPHSPHSSQTPQSDQAPSSAQAAVAADPRAVDPVVAAAPAVGGKVCVACRAGHVDTDGYCENCGHAQPRKRDHMEQELGAVAAVSDRGLRHHRNEDAFAVSSTALPDGSPAVVAIVCDGVSSATRPDEASQAAATAANELLLEALPRGTHPQQAMRDAILAAATAVNSLAAHTPHGDAMDHDPHRHQNAPACTIVGAVSAGGLLIVGWVGDSRAYWVPDDRGGPSARLTEDDSWAAQMVAAGLMNEAEAYADERAHAITGWLGADAYELEPHTAAFKPDRSGVVVVCTDGLWNYAEGADEMARVLPPDAADRPLHSAQVLVGHALDGGGHDNVTVAVLPFAVARQGAGSAYTTYNTA
ncbi:PP2C family serine/threonine-protein phosphatase [Streptomyces sp. NPDC004838]